MSRKSPLVSVIIPSYNHLEYVEVAIRSVTRQTYSNIELIVVDDGSNDGSPELLSKLRNELGFILVLQSNSGVCRTLNLGIQELSKGELLCILASDDYFHPLKVEKQVNALQSNTRSEFCFTQATEFDSDTGKELRIFPKKLFSGDILNRVALRQPYAAGSIMFTRRLYDRVDGFDQSLAAEDWDFSIRCASATEFTGVNDPLFYYRSHSTNTMKILSRREIFHSKAIILSKNYMILKPRIWFFAIIFHFLYDHGYSFFKRFKIRNIVN